ncbi:phosphotransferase [Candidatus Carsonella ruddii]|uniref:Valyl-tRNA synthetase n=1 Tax=Carsonella ruddii TaxID=114186 RepID=A0A1U9RRS0_CARRU|nr:phosphotransferase [Candidatus Carsonella ruddii]AQU89604.1 Valyl-tRNA synthetase [Candidatus Carsonella ruddii]
MFDDIYHVLNILYKFSKKNYIKIINFGTNSKNCFIKKNNFFYFYSIIKKNYIKINNIKIFQNNFYLLTKILFFIYNLLLYKKNFGKVLFNFFINIICKISFFISLINKKKKFFFIYNFKIFLIKNKNFLFKRFFFLKNNIILKSIIFNHNDLFKDNILLFGEKISSFIDFNNCCYLPINNDLINLILEFTENYLFKKNIILENYYKKKKNIKINFFFILKIFVLRKKKMIFLKNIKNPNNYLKKYFYEKNF